MDYYFLSGSQDIECFANHKGFFNICNQYLVLNLGLSAHKVLIDRTNTAAAKYKHKVLKQKDEDLFYEILREALVSQEPQEMISDFPELLEKFSYMLED